MEQILTTHKSEITSGQCIPKFALVESGIIPTGINCFEYSPYMLYQKGNKRFVLQPLPHNEYKVVRIYDFVPANYS